MEPKKIWSDAFYQNGRNPKQKGRRRFECPKLELGKSCASLWDIVFPQNTPGNASPRSVRSSDSQRKHRYSKNSSNDRCTNKNVKHCGVQDDFLDSWYVDPVRGLRRSIPEEDGPLRVGSKSSVSWPRQSLRSDLSTVESLSMCDDLGARHGNKMPSAFFKSGLSHKQAHVVEVEPRELHSRPSEGPQVSNHGVPRFEDETEESNEPIWLENEEEKQALTSGDEWTNANVACKLDSFEGLSDGKLVSPMPPESYHPAPDGNDLAHLDDDAEPQEIIGASAMAAAMDAGIPINWPIPDILDAHSTEEAEARHPESERIRTSGNGAWNVGGIDVMSWPTNLGKELADKLEERRIISDINVFESENEESRPDRGSYSRS